MEDDGKGISMVLILSGAFVAFVGLDLISGYLERSSESNLILQSLLLAFGGMYFKCLNLFRSPDRII